MSYPLRLSPALDAQARERAELLGISLNALVAVALDAYLRGPTQQPAKVKPAPAAKPARKARAKPQQVPHEAPADWRFFHPDPDLWPYVDPEFSHRWESINEDDEAAVIALELEYWSTRQRPKPEPQH
jgi:hypothetical protein